MREILFRGKRKDSCGWIKGYYIFRKIWESDVHIIRTVDNGFDSYIEFEVIPETVGQYTGLTDKNGKKIFEGDIVKVCRGKDIEKGIVYYDKRIGTYAVLYNDENINLFFDIFTSKDPNVYIEIIGNIHDNPELLKEAEQE